MAVGIEWGTTVSIDVTGEGAGVSVCNEDGGDGIHVIGLVQPVKKIKRTRMPEQKTGNNLDGIDGLQTGIELINLINQKRGAII